LHPCPLIRNAPDEENSAISDQVEDMTLIGPALAGREQRAKPNAWSRVRQLFKQE
jgi:hypothetical protein